MYKDIYEMVTVEKNAYQAGPGILVAGNWYWKMYDHCNYSILMKNSQFPIIQTELGAKPNKNIIRPILNVAYRSEGFDVKDIDVFVNNPEHYYKSFIARKFHEKWARRNNLDTVIDESVEAYVDYGGVLVKRVKKGAPEIVSWQQIAFCDQTDILSGTIALRHQYSIDQLIETGIELKWYTDAIDEAVIDAKTEKSNGQNFGKKEQVPDKSIEVFEVHGMFPETWLAKDDEYAGDYNDKLNAKKYSKQIHIITYTKDKDGNNHGICLFKGPEKKPIFKFLSRDKVYGRALGFGGVEELFESQIWTNFNMINMQNMLREASKVVHVTNDAGFTTRNNVRNIKGGDFLVLEDGKETHQLNTQPVNIALFDKACAEWEMHARTTGSANDAQLGVDAASGTPFALQNLITSNGQSLHQWRRGKLASFWGEIYRDWILEDLVEEMNNGDEWIHDLSVDEMQMVSEAVMTNVFNDHIKKVILSGQMISQDELTKLQQQFKQEFGKSSKKFLKILKGEFAELPMDVEVNIVGKQKDLAGMTEKLTKVFQTIISNPRVLQIPYVAKIFNKIMETAGLDQMDFDMKGMPFPPIGTTIRETINYKDVAASSPDAGSQMLGMLGIEAAPQPSPVQPTNLPVNK